MAKHVHKYKKVKLGKGKDYVVYACALPDCTHYLPSDLIVGKQSLCWRCGDKFIINERNRNLKKPHCRNCTASKTGKIKKETGTIREVREEMFDGLIPRIPKL